MSGPDWGGEQSCANCGHPASYHGVTFCQVDAGGAVKQQCDCFGWAARAAAPPVEPHPTSIEAQQHRFANIDPEALCPVCSFPAWTHDPATAFLYNQRIVPPSPVAGLREAADALVDEWDAAMRGDAPLDGHYQRQALERLRAALLDEPVPLDVERQFDVVDKTLLVTFGWSDKDHQNRYGLAAHNFLRRLQEVGWDVTITDPAKAALAARLTDPKGATE